MFAIRRFRAPSASAINRAGAVSTSHRPPTGDGAKVGTKTKRLSSTVMAWSLLIGLLGSLATVMDAPQAVAATGDDGLSVSITPSFVTPGTGQAFTLLVTDSNDSHATFDSYYIYGLPSGWTVRDNGATATPISTTPIIYALPKADVTAGRITVTPPTAYSGTLTGVSLARVSNSPNLIKAFDNGTFDWLGVYKPMLNQGESIAEYENHTDYEWSDPTVTHGATFPQYGPLDGYYSIWPTADMNGPQINTFNNKWADLRSIDNPMTVDTNTVCYAWQDMSNSYQVPEATVRNSGKIAVFNGALSSQMPVPNDLLRTTVTGLLPNHYYTFGAYVANVSDDRNSTLPVRVSMYVKNSRTDVGTAIGSSQDLPKQPACFNNQTSWTHLTGIVNTGSASQLLLSIRNYEGGGFGNDLAIDNLTLYPMAQCPIEFPVTRSNPGLTVEKKSVPADGSTVTGGQTVTYTVTGSNTGNTDLNPVKLTDNLATVLSYANYVAGSAAATIDGVSVGAPTLTGTTLQWSGAVPQGKSVVVTYKVTVKPNLLTTNVLRNAVIGSGEDPAKPGVTVPSNCVDGTERGCFTELTPAKVEGWQLDKSSNPVSGSLVNPGQIITYTVTGVNTGNSPQASAFSDDLTNVLTNATLVAGSVTLTYNGNSQTPPALSGNKLSWSGNVPAGGVVVMTYQVKVNDNVAANVHLHNTVTGPGSNCLVGTEPDCSSDVTTAVPGLHVTKTSSPANGATVLPGANITYTVTAQNTGNVNLASTTVTDELAGVLNHAAFVAGSATATVDGLAVATPSLSGNTLTWTGPLAIGKTVIITYQVTVNANATPSDKLRNAVVGQADNPNKPGEKVTSNCVDGTEDGCFTEVTPAETTGWDVSKVSNPASGSKVSPNQVIAYTITGVNSGNTASSHSINDNLSQVLNNATLVPGSISLTVNGVSQTPPTLVGTNLNWSGSVPAGASVVLSYQVKVNGNVAPGAELKNVVTSPGSNCDDGTDPECSPVVTTAVPTLVVHKSSDPADGDTVAPGGLITYTVTARNSGNTNLVNVILTDDLSGVLSHASYMVGSETATIDGAPVASPSLTGTTLSWMGNLPIGKMVTLTYQVKVDDDVLVSDVLVNGVVGTSEDQDNPGVTVPSNCVYGTEDGCFTEVTPEAASGWQLTKTASLPPSTRGPVLVYPGGLVNYTITGVNTGNDTRVGATFTDDMSAMMPYVSLVPGSVSLTINDVDQTPPSLVGGKFTWTGDVPAGATVVLTYQVKVNDGIAPGTQLTNAITGEGSNCEEGTDPDCTVIVDTLVPELTVAKSSSPGNGSTVMPGSNVTYTVTGQNTGTADLAAVILTDDMSRVLNHATVVPGSLSASVDGSPVAAPTLSGSLLTWTGPLAVGQTVTLTYQVKVDANATPNDKLRNAVVGSADDPGNPGETVPSNCVEGTEDGCYTEVTPNETTGWNVSKVSDPSSGSKVSPNQVITYVVTGENTGNTASVHSLVDDMSQVLDNASLVSGSVSLTVNGVSQTPPVLTSGKLSWSGSVPAGASVVLAYQVKVNAEVEAGAHIKNMVTSPASNCKDGTDPECSSVVTTQVPGLHVEKTSNPSNGSTVTPAGTITYTVTAHNTGNVDLSPVILTDDLSGIVPALGAFVSGSAVATIGGVPVTAPQLHGTTLTWTGALAAGQTVTLTYQVKVNSDVKVTDVLVNGVVGTGWDPENPGEAVQSNCEDGTEDGCYTELTPSERPGWHVTKTANLPADNTVWPGDTLTYTVTATNTGNATRLGATFTDDMSDVVPYASVVPGSVSLTVDGVSATPPTMTSDNKFIWLGDVPAGASVVLSYTVRVNSDVEPGTQIKNAATAPESNCEEGTDPDCTVVVTVKVPKLTVAKTSEPANGSTVRPGGIITYTVTAQNTGDVDLASASVTDNLTGVLAHASFVTGSASASINGTTVAAPAVSGTTLTWMGSLAKGETVTITYQVKVDSNAKPTDVLRNAVIGTAQHPGKPGTTVPSNCQDGTEVGCFTEVTPEEVIGWTVDKVSDPASGSYVDPGQIITYVITGQNTGNVDKTGAQLSDDMSQVLDNASLVPGSITLAINGRAAKPPLLVGNTISWTGIVPAGGIVVLTYQVKVNDGVEPGVHIHNLVTSPGSDCQEGVDPQCSSDVETEVPRLVVQKVSDPGSGGKVAPGGDITYTVTAQNTGNVDLSPVLLTDDLANVLAHATFVDGSATASIGATSVTAPGLSGTTLTWSGDLAAGQMVTLTYQVRVDSNAKVTDKLVNKVIGTGWNPHRPNRPVPSNCQDGTEDGCHSDVTPEEVTGWVVSKSSNVPNGSMVSPNQVITYSITGTNTGNSTQHEEFSDDLTNVLLHASLVDGSVVLSVDGTLQSQLLLINNKLSWSGDVPAEASVVLTYQVKVDANVEAGVHLNNTVTSPNSNCQEGSEPDCSTDVIAAVPGLHVEKTSDPTDGTTVLPGDDVTYTVTATNTGNTDLNPVVVKDDLTVVLSHGSFVTGSAFAEIDGVAVAAPTLTGHTLSWTGELPEGKSVVITYKVTVDTTAVAGDTLLNKVTGTGVDPTVPDEAVPSNCVDGTEDGCHTEVTVRDRPPVREPGLDVSKKSDPANGSRVQPGQLITYTLTAINMGNVDLTDVVVTDSLADVLSHATFVAGSITVAIAGAGPSPATPTFDGTTLRWNGDLEVNAILTLTYQVLVNQDVKLGDFLVNKVTSSAKDPDNPDIPVPTPCVTGDEPDCYSRLDAESPGLSITKSSTPTSGSKVKSNQIITYTITAKNTGDTTIDPVTLTDDMSGLLNNASYIANSAKVVIDGNLSPIAPTLSGATLTWTGALDEGQTATLTYEVKVNNGVKSGTVLANRVTGSGTTPNNPDHHIPSTCVTGDEPGCHTEVTVTVEASTGGSVQSSGAMIPIVGLALFVAAIVAAGAARFRMARR